MDPGLRRGHGDRGITSFHPPPLPPPVVSKGPRRRGGRGIQRFATSGMWSSGIRRRGRKPPFRTCAGSSMSARPWAAVRAVRRGRAGRVRDKRVNSPAHPGPAGKRPRGALRRRRNGLHYPYAGRRPGAPHPPRLPGRRPGGPRTRVRHPAGRGTQ